MNLKTAKVFLLCLVAVCLAERGTFACDPNDELPGALPPAPNGGEIGEMKFLDGKAAVSEEGESPVEVKMFWEGLHLKDQKQVSLTLVAMKPPKMAVFTVLSPEQEVSDIQVKVENPRAGKIIAVPFVVMKDRVVVDFDSGDLNRFIVHVEGRRPDGMRKALVQIEEE